MNLRELHDFYRSSSSNGVQSEHQCPIKAYQVEIMLGTQADAKILC